MTWQCVLLEPTDRVQRALRRYRAEHREEAPYDLLAASQCAASGAGYHNATVRIEDGPLIWHPDHRSYATDPMHWPHDDPRWPTHCACGYQFADEDEWQLAYHTLYRLPGGRETTLRDAPAGAMWDAFWLAGIKPYLDRSPDGRVLVCMLPDGREWIIDDAASNGPGWTRTGTPPLVTATPSILTPDYHGFLTGGVLTDDLEGRRYER